LPAYFEPRIVICPHGCLFSGMMIDRSAVSLKPRDLGTTPDSLLKPSNTYTQSKNEGFAGGRQSGLPARFRSFPALLRSRPRVALPLLR